MEDSQREAMYDGWAKNKKWVKVEVKELESGGWMATPIGELGCVVYRDTKSDVISAIHSKLVYKGYEISNLAEIQGIL